MDNNYRVRKELFVSNLNGTTVYETGSIMINICTTYFLCQILKSFIFFWNIQKYSLWNYLFEYFILIISMILICTYLSSINFFFHFILWSISLILYLIKQKNSSIENHSKQTKIYSYIIENFRSQILIVTCICILAVDFPIFPRRYAKTENYGYSGMDLGVGLFALAHGMVSSEARNNQTYLKELFLENFILLFLGLIRLIIIKSFSYIEHISEYGLHWNFFLTLCFMKLFGHCLLLIKKQILFWICFLLIFHEFILLKYFHYENYLIYSNNIRKNFFDANREGIISLNGYICLYFIGIYIGKFIIINEYNYQFKQMFMKFFILTIILCNINYKPSRKLCNLSYISITTGLACMCLAGFSLIQWLLLKKSLIIQSNLLKNINQKGLDLFLLANILTGIINLNINTIDTSNFLALIIIIIYMFIITIVTYFSPSLIKLIMKFFKLSKSSK